MNIIVQSGNLVRDPDVRYSDNFGDFVGTARMAVDGKNGTEYFNLAAFRKDAERLSLRGKKGSFVVVSGAFHLRSFKGDDGVTRYAPEIRVTHIEIP